MKYFLIGKPGKHFKIADPKPVKNSSLMVFSGFKTSVKYLEGGLLLNVDYATRVVDRDNIYKFIVSKFPDFKTNKRSQQELKEFLTGKVVMAGYGKNRCYKLSDIDFESTPATEYIIINKPNEKGEEITKKVNLVEYYYSLYDKLKIEDPNKQPLLLIKKLIKGKERKGDNNSSVNGKLSLMTLGDKNYEIIKLVPSLCYISGISDDLRSDYSLMSSLAIHTKLEPAQRINKIRELVKELSNKCKQNLTTNGVNPKNIGFQIEGELAQKGKVIYPQTINLRSSEKGKENQLQADNGILKFRKGDKMKTEIDVGDWFLVYPKFEEELMDNLCQELKNAAFNFGVSLNEPTYISVSKNYPGCYVDSLNDKLASLKLSKSKMTLILFILVNKKEYDLVKSEYTCKKSFITQVVLSRTLKKSGKLPSICSNILFQISAKFSCPPWTINTSAFQKAIPRATIFIGMNLSKEGSRRCVGVSSSYDPEYSKYFTQTKALKREGSNISEEFGTLVFNSLKRFYTETRKKAFYPQLIVIYRDGVSDSQKLDLIQMEVKSIISQIGKINKDYHPGILFCTVNKTPSTRYFVSKSNTFSNPEAGTYIDCNIVEKGMFAFYLIPQSVTQGSATPVKFQVIYKDNIEISVDEFITITNAFCYNYFNWKGAIRTPAPCKYAKKAADFLSKVTKTNPKEELQDYLYFL